MSDPFGDLCDHGWLWDSPCVWCENEALRAHVEAVEGRNDNLAVELRNLRSELAAHRKYIEIITDGGTDYPETMDEMIDLGLVVEAPPTQDFIDEWGDDCEMYVLAWSPLASRALDGEKVVPDEKP